MPVRVQDRWREIGRPAALAEAGPAHALPRRHSQERTVPPNGESAAMAPLALQSRRSRVATARSHCACAGTSGRGAAPNCVRDLRSLCAWRQLGGRTRPRARASGRRASGPLPSAAGEAAPTARTTRFRSARLRSATVPTKAARNATSSPLHLRCVSRRCRAIVLESSSSSWCMGIAWLRPVKPPETDSQLLMQACRGVTPSCSRMVATSLRMQSPSSTTRTCPLTSALNVHL